MAGYLEEYGASDERRSRVIRWLVISVAAAFVLGIGFYLTYPLFSGYFHVRGFVGDLRRHDYRAAYRDWGCATPCPDYSFDEFMKDWGPKSHFGDAASAGVSAKVRPCGGGVIVRVHGSGPDITRVWYKPEDHTLTFWPWQGCPNRIEAPETPKR